MQNRKSITIRVKVGQVEEFLERYDPKTEKVLFRLNLLFRLTSHSVVLMMNDLDNSPDLEISVRRLKETLTR